MIDKSKRNTSLRVFEKQLWSKIMVLNLLLVILLGFCTIYFTQDIIAARANDTEPNDDFNSAVPLMNDVVDGEVTDLDTVDYYRVDLNAGQTLKIKLDTNLAGSNITLKLFDNQTNELWSSGLVGPDVTLYHNYTVNQTPISPYYLGVFPEVTGNLYTLKTTIISQNDAASGNDAPDNIENALEIYGGTITGFLADMDVDDFYKFKVNPARIIKFNFSTMEDSSPVNFDVYNDLSNKIKIIQDLSAGNYVEYQYTTNNNGTRTFYIGTNLGGGIGNYSISVDIQAQEDAQTYTDAGDNLTHPTPLTTAGTYNGWLASGKAGFDEVDVYNITVPVGNNTFYINITPDLNLNLMIFLYNETYGEIKSLNPGPGVLVKITYIFNTTQKSMVYLMLKIDDGKTSYGEYSIEFTFIKIKPQTGDSDNDNMPDTWETLYSLNPEDPADADLDADLDGYTNLEEFLAGTDPTDPKSHPIDGGDYSHLTEQAVQRMYDDAGKDVFYWSGTYDNTTLQMAITVGKVIDKPDYDIITLESKRVNEELVVKLSVAGKIEDLGASEEAENGNEYVSGTIYEVFFVNKTYTESKIDNNNVPIMGNIADPMIPIPLIYLNGTFFGPPGTNGNLIDNGQTLKWRIPLSELTALNTDFELYGFSNSFQSTNKGGTRASLAFKSYIDTAGTGSRIQERIIKLIENIILSDRNISVVIDTDMDGGNIKVTEIGDPPDTPSNVGSLDFFIEIQLTGGIEAENVFITIEYKNSDLPQGFSEKDIKMFYYDEDNDTWRKVKKSGVWANNNTAWAQLDHLTIFSPMAEQGGRGSGGDTDDNWWFMIILILVIVIVIIIVVVAAVLRSKRRVRREPVQPPPKRPKRALTPEYFDCPRCREEIEIPYSESEKVFLECPECGSKGKIDNPYLKEAKDLDYTPPDKYQKREHEREYDEGRDRDYDRDRDRGYDRDQGRDYETDYEQEPYKERDYYDDEEVEQEYEPTGRDQKRPASRTKPRTEKREPPRPIPVVREPVKEEIVEDDDYEYKNCPKCGERIEIPYLEDDKIQIKCPNCGAKGKIKNPYLA
jgi:transcription elongation factor Elf1